MEEPAQETPRDGPPAGGSPSGGASGGGSSGDAAGGGQGGARPTVFLTGGTGLVGSHAAARWRDEGWTVRALVRPGSDTRFLEELGCELVLGDLEEPASFRGAAEGCRVAVHCAALVAGSAPWERYRSLNVEGTRHVVTESLRSGCTRLVHLSSVAVYGHPEDHEEMPLSETSPTDLPLPDNAYYERSKRMAEDVVRRLGSERLRWCILRPPVLMGERDRQFTPRLVSAARRPVLPRLGSGSNDLALVYAGNVALATWLAGTREAASGRTYNVTDDGRLTQREMLSILRELVPDSGIVLPVPEAVLRAAVGGMEAFYRALPESRSAPVTRRNLWFLSHDDPYDCSRARRELRWEPERSTREAWRRSVRSHLRRREA